MKTTFDVIAYVVPFVTGIVGTVIGHFHGASKAKAAILKFAETVKAEVPKAEDVAKHIIPTIRELVQIPVVKTAVSVVEKKAEKAVEAGSKVRLINYALLGLVKFGKNLVDMNDAEKYAIAQFVTNSVPAEDKGTFNELDVVNAIGEAQKLLDAADKNPLLQKAIELTGLAKAFEQTAATQPTATTVTSPTPTTAETTQPANVVSGV